MPLAERCPVRAVILDLDGTLVDSEALHLAAYRHVLASFGVDFTEKDRSAYVGRAHLDTWVDLQRRHGLPTTPEALVTAKNKCFLEIADPSGMVFPAMRRFVEGIGDRGLPLAVASGSSRVVVEKVLAGAKLRDSFGVVVSAEEVACGKPAPDIFLAAAERLGLPPRACVVVEDSPAGVEAAVQAHMRCIAVPSTTEPPLASVFTLADHLVAGGMKTFDATKALAWIDAWK